MQDNQDSNYFFKKPKTTPLIFGAVAGLIAATLAYWYFKKGGGDRIFQQEEKTKPENNYRELELEAVAKEDYETARYYRDKQKSF